MIADCANSVLRRAHVGEGPPPQVSEHWARRFLERHPEYHVRKQLVQEVDRKKAQDPDTGGFMSSRESATSTEYNDAIFTTSTSPGSLPVLERTRRLLHVPSIVRLSLPSAVIPIERQ